MQYASYRMVCASVQQISHSLKLVDYLHIQTKKHIKTYAYMYMYIETVLKDVILISIYFNSFTLLPNILKQ